MRSDALFFADTGTACIWAARHITYGAQRRLFGSYSWASMANASPNACKALDDVITTLGHNARLL
jgi:thiamine pyrophosphate-dependent acetolactate synthase large subunit-like protein